MTRLFSFFKNLIVKCFKLVNYIRLFLLNALFLLIVLVIIISINDQEESVVIADNAYLTLNLNGFLVEQKQPVNLSQQLSNELSGFGQDQPQEFEVKQVINIIRHAQNDHQIIGIMLELGGLQSGSLDQLSDIGDALNAFKATGKKIFAYADNYSQTQYYLASYADEISLAPNGFVLLQGYAVNRLYFKDLIDKLLITPHIFKVGTYKSFVEPYTQTSMSTASKQANTHWLNQLWQGYINNVLAQRANNEALTAQSINPSLKQLKKSILAVAGDSGQYALSVGLVDKLQYKEAFVKDRKLKQTEQGKKFNTISYQTYASRFSSFNNITGSSNQIAIIYGSGEIISGQSDGTNIADKTFNKLIKQALDNSKVKAVVLRLDTPGGSAFASENIRQQVLALKAANKKVIVSMGSVSASGGYWIASAADKIIAYPTTLTGSIGIFGMFATVDKSLNKIGIHQDGVATNELSNIGITQPLNPELAEIFQIGIESGYANFLQVVSEGRNMSVSDVDKVAQGRVWTGNDAHKNGLVDELGNLQTAINLAASITSLTEYDVVTIKPKVTSKQAFINEVFSNTLSWLPRSSLKQTSLLTMFSEIESQANIVNRMNDPQNRFVFCTTCNIQ